MKRFILLFGLLGLLGCFLPLVLGMSLFDTRHFEGNSWHVWLVIAAFAVPAYVGAAHAESDRVAAGVGALSFGYLAFKFGTGVFDLLFHASIGGIMMGVAVIGGLASSLLTLAASER